MSAGRRWVRQRGQVVFWYSIHCSTQPLWKRCPQESRFTTDSDSNWPKQIRQSPCRWSSGRRQPNADPNRTGMIRLRNLSVRFASACSETLAISGVFSATIASISGVRPKMWSADRKISLRIEIVSAVFTTRRVRTDSDGVGRLESPIVAGSLPDLGGIGEGCAIVT